METLHRSDPMKLWHDFIKVVVAKKCYVENQFLMLMKKIMLTLVAVFVISMATTYAQSDTTTTTAKQTTTMDQSVPKGYTAIKVDDVPSSLRTTLGGQEYLGWESGTVYQNRSNNQYLVRIGTGQDTKSYYFDNSGKRIKSPKEE
jgi:hypothetical protein